jgi:hypothetical protein
MFHDKSHSTTTPCTTTTPCLATTTAATSTHYEYVGYQDTITTDPNRLGCVGEVATTVLQATNVGEVVHLVDRTDGVNMFILTVATSRTPVCDHIYRTRLRLYGTVVTDCTT